MFSCLYNADYNFQCFLVPDVVITTSLANLNVNLTTDFYRLLRGFLSMNLGDPLVPASETIPIEVLQKPAELHASFQLILCRLSDNASYLKLVSIFDYECFNL